MAQLGQTRRRSDHSLEDDSQVGGVSALFTAILLSPSSAEAASVLFFRPLFNVLVLQVEGGRSTIPLPTGPWRHWSLA